MIRWICSFTKEGELVEGVLDYENLVYSVVHKYGKKYDKEDLYQVGMVGLLEAKKKYNGDYDTKFSTFAYYYILGEVTKYIRESKSIKLSKDMVRLNRSITHAKEVMEQRLGRSPNTHELSVFLEIPEEKIDEVLVATQETESLDYENLYNFVANSNSIDDLLDLKDELRNLDAEERKLIRCRYYEDLTQTELSKRTGISQVQISRKENKILKKLKERL